MKTLIYLDANVLIPSVTRGLLLIGAVTSDFQVRWSAFGESEAERHQHERARKISVLRRRFGWNVLVPDAEVSGMVDTDSKDQPHLAAAHASGARLIVTENIKDFGTTDLNRLSMSAVTPDLFLSVRLEERSYVEVLKALAEGRTREPRTPADIHAQEVAPRLPTLAGAFTSTFGVPLVPPAQNPMVAVFRGCRCVRCENIFVPSGHAQCESCRSATAHAKTSR